MLEPGHTRNSGRSGAIGFQDVSDKDVDNILMAGDMQTVTRQNEDNGKRHLIHILTID